MTNFYTTEFDELFKSNISHLTNYPEMLPFVGLNWMQSKKILLIGESHWLPYDEIKTYSGLDYFTNWYDFDSKELNENHKKYITTRNNLLTVEFGKYEKSLTLYFNLKKALLEISHFSNSKLIFDKFSFYNYFQKPTFVRQINNEDRSIKPTTKDKEIAFETFQKIINIIKPESIIFISKKSFDSFNEVKSKRNISFEMKIDFVPHAGRPWWNKNSESYGNRTGKQKFIDIIKLSYLD